MRGKPIARPTGSVESAATFLAKYDEPRRAAAQRAKISINTARKVRIMFKQTP
jgi:hypothetical protein